MKDYKWLIDALRHSARRENSGITTSELMFHAADAIERLSMRLRADEAWIAGRKYEMERNAVLAGDFLDKEDIK